MIAVKISNQEIRDLISARSAELLEVINYLPENLTDNGILTRPLLGNLMLQSIVVEELLDSYGAKNNTNWKPFRTLIATTRILSSISYELLHVIHAFGNYKLIDIERDFMQATNDTLVFTSCLLLQTGTRILIEAESLGIDIPETEYCKEKYYDFLPPGKLPHDIKTRKTENTYETITLLATAFLNLARECRILHKIRMPDDNECCSYYSDTINEEFLRHLKEQFHNLQSLYDTYVSDTEVENIDSDLVILRGHISVTKHLLSIATGLSHYYERYIRQADSCKCHTETAVNPKELLFILIDYAIGFSIDYVNTAVELCHEMLRRYTEITEIEVSIPVYRGFHVRPSTLVSSIVQHYGTEVEMQVADEVINPAIPLEIFRINEKINAEKRKQLARKLTFLSAVNEDAEKDQILESIKHVMMKLAEDGLIVIYEHPLELSSRAGTEDDIMIKRITCEIARLLAEGKIDICIDMTIKFIGDKRVLRDLKLLTENGYGEDKFGNNIPLPPELGYLRK